MREIKEKVVNLVVDLNLFDSVSCKLIKDVYKFMVDKIDRGLLFCDHFFNHLKEGLSYALMAIFFFIA